MQLDEKQVMQPDDCIPILLCKHKILLQTHGLKKTCNSTGSVPFEARQNRGQDATRATVAKYMQCQLGVKAV
jgi:hypothetical protein